MARDPFGARYADAMDPSVMALVAGLQQARNTENAQASAAPVAARSGDASTRPSLADRCGNAPLFTLEGEPVRLDLTAGAWLARLRGNVAFGPVSTSKVDVNDTYGLDSMEAAFQGDLSILWRNWTVRLTGAEFSTDATQAASSAGALRRSGLFSRISRSTSFMSSPARAASRRLAVSHVSHSRVWRIGAASRVAAPLRHCADRA